MKNTVVFLLVFYSLQSIGQTSKPVIDEKSYATWTNVENPALSPNGLYAIYYLRNTPHERKTLVCSSTDGTWTANFSGASDGVFSKKTSSLFFTVRDTLYSLNTVNKKVKTYPNVGDSNT